MEAQEEVLERLISLDSRDLASEAKVERCRATRDLRSCGRSVKHILTSCGHASLCAECSQRCDVCPFCRAPIDNRGAVIRLRLFDECSEAGLITKRDEDFTEREGSSLWTVDVQRLWSFFDIALEHNQISVICHYVLDICMDEMMVSSDAVTSMLWDGAAVKEWCKRAFSNVVQGLHDIYSLEPKSMYYKLSALDKFSGKLAGIIRVLESLESPAGDSNSVPAVELHHFIEVVRRASQHLTVMSWCGNHGFLESISSCHSNIKQWKGTYWERKVAARERAWHDPIEKGGHPEATLFIEDALSHIFCEDNMKDVSELCWLRHNNASSLSTLKKKDTTGAAQLGLSRAVLLYPFDSVWMAVDFLFLEGSSEFFLAKKAIFLYYLFDRQWGLPQTEWKNIVEDYVGCMSLGRSTMLESLVFYLLDEMGDEALEEACRLLPEIVSPTTHPKIARVLLERRRPNDALNILRCSGQDGSLGLPAESEQSEGEAISLSEALIALRIRLECGLLTEAYLYQRTHCARIKAWNERVRAKKAGLSEGGLFELRNWLSEMTSLVGELCWLCIRKNTLESMLELPWQSDEEVIIHKCMLNQAAEDPVSIAGNLLVVYYIQRCRYVEAFLVHKNLCEIEQQFASQCIDEKKVEHVNSMNEQRSSLVGKFIELLPEVQRKHLENGDLDHTFSTLLAHSQESTDLESLNFKAAKNNENRVAAPSPLLALQPSSKKQLRSNPLLTSGKIEVSAPSSPVWGGYRQPSNLHGQAFKPSSGGLPTRPRVDSPTLNGISPSRSHGWGGGLISPLQGRRLKYDIENIGKPSDRNGQLNSAEPRRLDSLDSERSIDLIGYYDNEMLEEAKDEVQEEEDSMEVVSSGRGQNGAHPLEDGLTIASNNIWENGNGLPYRLGLKSAMLKGSSSPLKESPRQLPRSRFSGGLDHSDNLTRMNSTNLSSSRKRQPSERPMPVVANNLQESDLRLSDASNLLSNQGGTRSPFLDQMPRNSSNLADGNVVPSVNGSLRWRNEDGDDDASCDQVAPLELKAASMVTRKSFPRSRFSKHIL